MRSLTIEDTIRPSCLFDKINLNACMLEIVTHKLYWPVLGTDPRLMLVLRALLWSFDAIFTHANGSRLSIVIIVIYVCVSVCVCNKSKRLKLQSPNLPHGYIITSLCPPFQLILCHRSRSQSHKMQKHIEGSPTKTAETSHQIWRRQVLANQVILGQKVWGWGHKVQNTLKAIECPPMSYAVYWVATMSYAVYW